MEKVFFLLSKNNNRNHTIKYKYDLNKTIVMIYWENIT